MNETLWIYGIKVVTGLVALAVAYLFVILFLGAVGWTGTKLGLWSPRKPLNLPRHR